MNEELTVEELFEYANDQEKATLNWLIAKYDAAGKSKPEKSKCAVCGKWFWDGSPMRAHKKAMDHYTLSDRMGGFYDKLFLDRLSPLVDLTKPPKYDFSEPSDHLVKFHRYREETNG